MVAHMWYELNIHVNASMCVILALERPSCRTTELHKSYVTLNNATIHSG